jgi:ABC-2 type transport system permease protein
MKKYRIVFAKSFKSQMIYRAATLSSIAGTLLAFAIQLCLWHALLGTGVQENTDFSDMVLYVLVNTLVLTLTSANIAAAVEGAVMDGSISMEIIRPISYKYYQLASILGRNAFQVVTNVLPIAVISIFLIDIPLRLSAAQLAGFVVSLVFGILLMFEVTYIFGLLAFRIQRCWYLGFYIRGLNVFFGGTAVPLWFYPGWLQKVSYALPFRYITFEPVGILLGRTQGNEIWMSLLVAALWLLVLNAVDHLMWRSAVKGLSVNGG